LALYKYIYLLTYLLECFESRSLVCLAHKMYYRIVRELILSF